MDITEDLVQTIFSAYGNITSFRLLPPSPGQADTVALLRYASLDEAQWLKENLHGNIPQGLATPVHIKYKSGGGPKPAASIPGSAPTDSMNAGDNLYVKGLPLGFDDQSLLSIFGAYGSVASCRVLETQPGQT